MAIMAERDTAIREMNMALEERKRAVAERDMAILQRDAAIAERNSAMQERDAAMANLHYGESSGNDNDTPSNFLGNEVGREPKSFHQDQQMNNMYDMPEVKYSPRELLRNDNFQISEAPSEVAKPRKVKQAKEFKDLTEKPAKSRRVGKKGAEKISKVTNTSYDFGVHENQDRQNFSWKDNLELNQVNYDDTAMPVPVCSCTGVPQPCYKWGSGGWQSACCTTTMSMYPLPQVSNKKYSRVGGRKMSGGAFSKLLNRLHDEGYDLSAPLDLKNHWAKHGTNRYSTVK